MSGQVFFVFCFATIVLITGSLRGEIGFSEYHNLKGLKTLLEERIKDLTKDIEHLRLEQIQLTTSKEYARKVLRDKYHLTEDNERIVFFTD